MRRSELSPEDQKLLSTDLGAFEKEAQAHVALCQEMYETGFSKLAAETADELDALYSKTAEEAQVEEINLDSGSEKLAQDLGAFIERGYFDGLRKLGQERYGDETAYLYPFIEEKVAAGAAAGAKEWLAKRWSSVADKAKGVASSAAEKAKKLPGAAKDYHKSMAEEASRGGKSLWRAARGRQPTSSKTDMILSPERRKEMAVSGLKDVGKAALRATPHAATLGLGGWGASKLMKKKEGQD